MKMIGEMERRRKIQWERERMRIRLKSLTLTLLKQFLRNNRKENQVR